MKADSVRPRKEDPLEEYLSALEQAYVLYREELDECLKKRKPTDGLLGFGRTVGDEPCHDRLDERLAQAVAEICRLVPSPGEAGRAVRTLLRDDLSSWHPAAQWMLRAAERHAIGLIPFLDAADAKKLLAEYNSRYKRWDRLPAQKKVFQALKDRSAASPEKASR